MENRLARESSPYLLQHAHNPVDWYPWGDEAFERAVTLDRPILLSIGYSACHWCHVMERESFEDADTASLMNELFVNVKVDREERPDVDHIYMQAVQALTGRGGWPLTAFLKPDREPFYGGTYFPPERRHGMPAFREVLRAAAAGYTDRREEVDRAAARLKEVIARSAERGSDPESQEAWQAQDLDQSVRRLAASFDPAHGGFGAAPKFPQPMVLEFLLRHHRRTGDAGALSMTVQTLRAMAGGGMRDHVGGGFHRYSVDERWLVPHFEKMLYDNALLASVYVHAHLLTGDSDLRETAESTLDYMLADLTSPSGGFYSARDADSEGEEGLFYVWSVAEIDDVLGDDGPLFRRVYDVSEIGNFEGHNILHLPHDLAAIARAEGLSLPDLAMKLDAARSLLYDRRLRRSEPLRDEKILTSWSALGIRALSTAGGALQRPDYVEAASTAARFLLGPMRPDGALQHTHKDGVSRVPAMLRDVAGLGNALLDLYLADPQPIWLKEADWTATQVLERFWDDEAGLLFDTAHDGEALIVRPRDLQDGAIPSGHALAAELLLRIDRVLGRKECRRVGTRLLHSVPDALEFPLAFSHTLSVAATTLTPPLEVVLLGDRLDPAWGELHREVTTRYLPGLVFLADTEGDGGDHGTPRGRAPVEPDAGDPGATSPLLEGKRATVDAPTAYVCWHHTCSPAVTEPGSLGELLDQAAQGGLDDSHGHG